jgi:hypothetical protein
VQVHAIIYHRQRLKCSPQMIDRSVIGSRDDQSKAVITVLIAIADTIGYESAEA